MLAGIIRSTFHNPMDGKILHIDWQAEATDGTVSLNTATNKKKFTTDRKIGLVLDKQLPYRIRNVNEKWDVLRNHGETPIAVDYVGQWHLPRIRSRIRRVVLIDGDTVTELEPTQRNVNQLVDEFLGDFMESPYTSSNALVKIYRIEKTEDGICDTRVPETILAEYTEPWYN